MFVFLGPSLDRARASAILPDAVLLPPVRQGELLSIVDRERPEVVAVIDGEFGQSLAVWHKEILHALGLGVRVFGASSMGALRAAECDVYGMEGVGRIYEWYRDGVLTDDDEVALLHGPADDEWRNLTWPMVNVRATVAALRDAGAIDATTADDLVAVAKGMYFGDRTAPALTTRLAEHGRADALELGALLRSGYVDQKAADAEALLQQLADGPGPAPGATREPRERLSWLGHTLRLCDTDVVRPTGTIERRVIVHDAAVHEADFEELQVRALNRTIVAEYAKELGFDPGPEELEAERAHFLERRGLTEETLPDWLAENDLPDDLFEALLVDEVRGRRMRRWYLHMRGYERNCGAVTDQLRIEGRYPEVADRAARRAELARHADLTLSESDEALHRIVAEHVGATDFVVRDDLVEWLDVHGFESTAEWLVTLSAASAARREGARRSERSKRALAALFGEASQ